MAYKNKTSKPVTARKLCFQNHLLFAEPCTGNDIKHRSSILIFLV